MLESILPTIVKATEQALKNNSKVIGEALKQLLR